MQPPCDKLNLLAIELLEFLGNKTPTEEQISTMERLLSNSVVCQSIAFDDRLSSREKMCLQLAANGESTESTARIMKVSPATIATHKRRIREKLMTKTMGQSIYVAMRFGWIKSHFSPIQAEDTFAQSPPISE